MGFGIKKEAGSNSTPSEIVNFDKLTPTTSGVVFDPNTPQTEDVLYLSSVDASTWIWNGTAYVTYSPPATATTEWYLNGTTIDAGSNKTAPISRDNSIYAKDGDSYFYDVRIGRGGGNQISNTVVGNIAGAVNTTGTFNSYFGYGSGSVNTVGTNNSFFGYSSGVSNVSGNNNSFFGDRSGYNNTTGFNNTFIGKSSGFTNTTSYDNSFIGFNAGYNNTNGVANTFIGSSAGYSNTSGTQNLFIGYQAGYFNNTGIFNTFSGYASGYLTTTGSYNSFFGNESGRNNTSGSYNTFIGDGSGINNTNGSANTFIGTNSGKFIADGITVLTIANDSVFLGKDTKALANSQTNQIVIGYNAIGKGSNTVNIGNTSITNTYLNGAVTFNNAFTFPTTDGTALQSLVTNGAGVVSWVDGSSAIPQTNTIYVDSVNGVNASTGRGDINKPYLTPEYALANITNTGTVTATTTNTSATLTAVSDTTNIKVGQYITGTGIPYGSLVVSKTSNTIVLSKACTASATITATWWTFYEVMLIGDFTVTSTIYKHGFIINADVYKATINFGAITLFNVLTRPLIPIYVYLNVTNGTSVSSVLFNTNNLYLDGGDMYFYYGTYYSIGTDFQIGSVGRHPSFTGKVYFKGLKFDARFGKIMFASFSGFFSWEGLDTYALLSGIYNYGSTSYYFNDNLVVPSSVLSITIWGTNANIYGSITGNTTIAGNNTNIYANISGTTHTLGGDGASTYVYQNYYGNINGAISNYGYCNYYGVITGTLNSLGGISMATIIGGMTGTITCTIQKVYYNSNRRIIGNLAVIIGAGEFINSGNINLLTSLTYTGAGTFTNNGKISSYVGANNVPNFTLSNSGTFINNGTINCTSECAAIFDKSASSTLINNGIMTNPLGMYVRYGTNSSPSRDLIIGNSICDGNLYAKPSAGCGTVNKFNVVSANTNTSVDIFDGTNTVTISVVGAGKTAAVIGAEIVTLIKASILRFQGTTYLSAYGIVVYVPLTGVTPTFTNLVNINNVGTINGGGGFTANVLAAGTELASSYYSNL